MFEGNKMSGMVNYKIAKTFIKSYIESVAKESTLSKKRKHGTVVNYLDVPCAFDIESSSFYDNGEKRATMYIWQFGINNIVIYGRTWGEFMELIDLIKSVPLNDVRIACYIHVFDFEFQWIRKLFNWDEIFFMEKRKPLYAVTGNIEFRCSYKLSGKRLEYTADDLLKYKCEKLVGSLDYSKLRTSTTPLTDEEMKYCEADIRVILSYVQEKIEAEKGIANIPYTKTGYVRRRFRKACLGGGNYRKYTRLMKELTLDEEEYKQLKRAFMGGFTHANADKVGETFESVSSFDFASSYPAVMLMEKFPMSKSWKYEKTVNLAKLEELLSKFCCLLDITIENVVSKPEAPDRILSYSKCKQVVGYSLDNGRIFTARRLTTTITEQDYWMLRKFYYFDITEVRNLRLYHKGYLPTPFIKVLVGLYGEKTRLKGVEGEERNYQNAKEDTNASYGMSVTDIIRDMIFFR